MKSSLACPLAALIALSCLSAAPHASAAAPADAVRSLATAYDQGSVAQLDELLTADYRFHTSQAALEAHYAQGFGRDRELLAAKNLFARYESATSYASVSEQPDPAHPEAPEKYRALSVHQMAMSMKARSADAHEPGMIAESTDHVIYVVRGDAALLPEGRTADPGRWYIREWYEDVAAAEALLAGAQGSCEAPAAADGGAGLAVHAMDSPLCPTLKLRCDLPGTQTALLEVFDLGGRRLAKHELKPAAAGRSVEIEAGANAPFAPGAYFVRLSQGRAKPVSKMVLVAK